MSDQVCTPSYTVDVAAGTVALIQQGSSGVAHLTNAGSCSWHDFAQTIFKLSGVRADLTPIGSAEYGAAARRPSYSVMTSTVSLRSWEEALEAYLKERSQRGPPRP